MGIADKNEFWVKIKRTERKDTEGKRVIDYTVDDVRENLQDQSCDTYSLEDLSGMMKMNDEYITEMKSVEIQVMRIQKEANLKTEKNRMCVISGRQVRC